MIIILKTDSYKSYKSDETVYYNSVYHAMILLENNLKNLVVNRRNLEVQILLASADEDLRNLSNDKLFKNGKDLVNVLKKLNP